MTAWTPILPLFPLSANPFARTAFFAPGLCNTCNTCPGIVA